MKLSGLNVSQKTLNLKNSIILEILKIIHHDQNGFVRNGSSADNMNRLLHVLNASCDSVNPSAVLSLDAEKAFDHLEWQHL